jgi:hypothetical protein
MCRKPFSPAQAARVRAQVLKAYRWQYIVTGVQHPHFQRVLGELTSEAQRGRIVAALGPILAAFAH